MDLNVEFSVWKECVANKRLFALAALVAIIGSCIVSASIPHVYVSRATISIDTNDKDPLEKGNALGALKQLLSSSESNVLSEPRVYMKIVQSAAFANSLRTATIVTKEGKRMSFASYLEKENRPWWSYENSTFEERIDDCVKYEMNTHNFNITVQVGLQDAVVACAMVDTVLNRLHAHLSEYMVRKAEISYRNLRDEKIKAENDYRRILKKKASYSDANFDAERADVVANMQALQNEAERLTEMRNTTALKAEMAKMEIGRTRPTFIKLVSNHVANSPLHPHWIANLLIWLFYSILAVLMFVLYRKKVKIWNERKI